VTPQTNPTPEEERKRIVAKRQTQLWLIAITMILSFCVGTTLVFFILWLLLK